MAIAQKTKVLHIITGLNIGGAEVMLFNLLREIDRKKFDVMVISLTDQGCLTEKITALDIRVVSLGLRRIWKPAYLFRLFSWLRQYRPDVVQTWLYSSDLIGGAAAKLTGSIPVVWGVHHSSLDPKVTSNSMIWKAKLCAALSSFLAAKIVCCSDATEKFHRKIGYKANKLTVIHNGFDIEIFKPDPAAREAVRQEIGINAETVLIGLVGRFDPQKDQHNFIRAAGLFQRQYPDVRYLLCGSKITWDNDQLVQWLDEAGIREKVYLLGRRGDIPQVMASLDIAVSASNTEAFPLVVGEAMAAGVPCVVTDVGDSGLIVGNTGKVVKPEDPETLRSAWQDMMTLGTAGRTQLGEQARKRIQERFTLALCARKYENLYSAIAARNV